MRIKQDHYSKCPRSDVADKPVDVLKSDSERKMKNRDVSESSQVDAVMSERMWEDVSDASENSEFSASYSDVSTLPASTRVTVVGNGLIQVTPADSSMRRFPVGADESETLMGLKWKTDDDMPNTADVVTKQELEQDVNVSQTDVDRRGHHLVQLQNILPLFVLGMNTDGSRSVQLAVIGDHKLSSDYLPSCQTSGPVSSTALSRNNHSTQ